MRSRASCASASRRVILGYVVIDLSRHVAAGSRRGANSDFILERPWRDSASKGRVRRAEGPTSSASVPPRAPRETDVEKMACDQQRASTATRRSERAQPSYVFDNAPDRPAHEQNGRGPCVLVFVGCSLHGRCYPLGAPTPWGAPTPSCSFAGCSYPLVAPIP